MAPSRDHRPLVFRWFEGRASRCAPMAVGHAGTMRRTFSWGIAVLRRELGQLSRLALPMILAQVSQMGMGLMDTIMAGRLSAVDLAGVALGSNLFWPSILFVVGVVMSLTPSVSQLHGAGRERESGEVVRQAFWIALAGGTAVILLLRNADALYRIIDVDPLAIPIAVGYLDALSWGVLPMLGYVAFRYLCDGNSWTLPAMVVALSGLCLKLPLNLLFIYGGLGLPAMGGVGCGYSSAIVMTCQCLAMACIVAFSRMRICGVFARFSLPNGRAIWRLIKLGLPIGASIFIEVSMFSSLALLIGRLGVEAVAAHQIANSVAGMTFMVALGLGAAASVRVGYNVGAEDLPAARRSGAIAISVSLVYALAMAVTIFVGRYWLTGLYSTNADVFGLAAELLLFVVVFQLFDDAQATCAGALRGYKDTRTPMWTAAFAYWLVGFPVGAVFGFGAFGLPNLGLHGFWSGLTAGLAVAAVALLLRFLWLSGQAGRIRELAGH